LFAVELLFNDGISPDELIVVRRQSFVLGSVQDADVILEGSSGAITPIRIERRRGRRFSAIPLEDDALPQIFNGEGELRVGEITLRIIPLDIDLVIASLQSLELAAARVLSRGLCHKPPEFPAIEIIGATNCVVSFPADQELLIGKSRNCAVRLEEDGIHQEHARVGYYGESNSLSDFWFEPKSGSTSYLEMEQPITDRVDVSTGQTIILSPGKCSIRFLAEEDESKEALEKPKRPSVVLSRYPCIVSRSELMKPERYPLSLGRRVSIGRDPSNEIWFNAVHVSRLHAEIALEADPINEEKNSVSITDFSSNGTFIDGVKLPSEVQRTLQDKLTVVDLSKGLTFAICFTAEQEEEYLGRKPTPQRRGTSLHGQILSQIQIPLTPFNSDEENIGSSEKPSWFSSSQLKSDQTNISSFNTTQSEAFTPLMSSDSAGISFSQRGGSGTFGRAEPESVEEYEIPLEEFAPVKRFGVTGKIMFWSAFLVLIVVNYFVYIGR
jgi:pSer/pThr/pTyr-binding forkhead associated (FHA) protein